MKLFLVAVALLTAGYVALVRWQMSKKMTERHNAVFAAVLRKLGVKGAMTLWTTIWLAKHPVTAGGALSPTGRRHERYHVEEQWAKHPYTFLFRYLFQWFQTAVRIKSFSKAYDCMQIEIDARLHAGQLSLCKA